MFARLIKALRAAFGLKRKTPTKTPSSAPKPQEPVAATPKPTGTHELWYPKAVVNKGGEMKTKGVYENGYPIGAVVHYTDGHCETEQDAINSLKYGIDQGFTFFVIGPTGVVYQNFPLSRWGSHAGTSYWPSIGSNVSKRLAGIEVACAGRVDINNKSWFKKVYPESRIRKVQTRDNVNGGRYVKFTEAQEAALIELLQWLKENNSKVFNFKYVLGHDEVAPDRKDDPGGCLSMTMPELRSRLLTAE